MNGGGSRRYSGVQAPGRVGLPPILQRPDLPVRARLTVGSSVMLWVVRPSWLWRREVCAVGVLVGLAVYGWLVVGWVGAVVSPVPLVVATAALPWSRRWAVHTLRRARLRREWDRACRFAGLSTVNDRIPRIREERWVPAGDRLLVRVPRGATVDELGEQAERVAAVLRVREVRVARDAQRADIAHVDIVRRDPFGGAGIPEMAGRIPWPWVLYGQASLWDPIPVAVDDMGDPVTMRLPGRNVVVAGEPEAGKSAALSLVLAAAALDPYVKVCGLDAKRLELALWKPVMDRVVGPDMDEAIDLMEDLIRIMDDRYELLEAAGRRSWGPSDGPLYLIPIDELRFYTANPNRSARVKFNELAIDLTARGRAAGMIKAAATQKPSSDVVPTSYRDLFAYRWAMRCTTRDASDTILGAGWATQGFSAAEIDVNTRGVGLLLAEAGFPRLCKSYYLEDHDIRAIAARGAALRRLVAGETSI
ncbi:FtsK/SpoIIIE domain-containing protein [Actinomadura sp. SCN-SB]|uniref:FtsK/SpoIIIE domain-containing protein n=1 Tax=Actinomadura sp. SCN-SB TaxID=3373092 RepID=UPI003753AA69